MPNQLAQQCLVLRMAKVCLAYVYTHTDDVLYSLSSTKVIVGMINGRVLLFDIDRPLDDPIDMTLREGRFPIVQVQWIKNENTLLVASIKNVVAYRFSQSYEIVSGQGAVCCKNVAIALGLRSGAVADLPRSKLQIDGLFRINCIEHREAPTVQAELSPQLRKSIAWSFLA